MTAKFWKARLYVMVMGMGSITLAVWLGGAPAWGFQVLPDEELDLMGAGGTHGQRSAESGGPVPLSDEDLESTTATGALSYMVWPFQYVHGSILELPGGAVEAAIKGRPPADPFPPSPPVSPFTTRTIIPK